MIRFFDKSLQRKFQRDGFAVIEFLRESHLVQVTELYDSFRKCYAPSNDAPVFSSCDTFDADLIRQLDHELRAIVEPQLNGVLQSYDYLFSSFLIKEPGTDNVTGYHQDPTLIERGDNSIVSAGLWCPLHNADAGNGCLRVIRGSHRLGDILAVTPNFPTIFETFAHKLNRFAEPLILRAGQAVIFDNKLIHGAFANQSLSSRVALVSAIKSTDCDWVYYYLPEENGAMVEKYVMDHEGYVNHRKGMRPIGELVGRFHHTFVSMSEREFWGFMFANYPIRTLRSLFS